jgi:ribosome biogenesis GTPase
MSAKRRRPANSDSSRNDSSRGSSSEDDSEHDSGRYDEYEDAFDSLDDKARDRRKRRSSVPGTGKLRDGRIVSRTRGHYRVVLHRSDSTGGDPKSGEANREDSKRDEAAVSCSIRGRLLGLEVPVVGDLVRVRLEGEEGVLEEVLPRRNSLTRVSEEDDLVFKIIAANVDVLGIVLAIDPHPPRWALADRMLVLSEREEFRAVIVLNKSDLLDPDSDAAHEINEAVAVYRNLGVDVCFTSALEPLGLDVLEELLREQISVLAGHSGVGKSSLMNALYPGLNLQVGSTNPQTGKGRHTTTLARLVSLPSGGYMVDTPGFREFGLGDVPVADLGRYYPEFRPIIGECRFSDCLHREEPGCALRTALERGEVSKLRYQNYLLILSGLVERQR